MRVVSGGRQRTELARYRDIIVTSPVGLQGSILLRKNEEITLRKRYTGQYLERLGKYSESAVGREFLQSKGLRDITQEDESEDGAAGYYLLSGEDGIYGSLWQLSGIIGCGFRVDVGRIPVLQETIEICNHLDVDPYRIDSSSAALIITDHAEELMEDLWESGHTKAERVGYLTGDHKCLIRNGDGERFLTPPERGSESRRNAGIVADSI